MGLHSVIPYVYRHSQRGVASVAIAFLILLLIAAALATAFGVSGSVVRDATMSTQQVQALFLAESGMARALKRYGDGILCANLGLGATGVVPDGPYHLGQGAFSVLSGTVTTTDFAGNTSPISLCRVKVVGIVAGVSRTIEAIMQRSTNGFPPNANTDFNSPPGACVSPGCFPTNWSNLSNNPAEQFTWDDFNGAPPNPPQNRAAYVFKSPGGGVSSAGGGFTFSPPITRTGPKTLKLSVDYKNSLTGNARKIHLTFTLHEKAPGTNVWTTSDFYSSNTSGAWINSDASPYPPPTIVLPAGTYKIDKIDFKFWTDSGTNFDSWFDNIKIDGEDTGGTTEEKAVIKFWREVVQ